MIIEMRNLKRRLNRLKTLIWYFRMYFKSMLRRGDYSGKIFCIGYNKTGTTTLGKSFELLGYRNSTFNHVVYKYLYLRGSKRAILNYTSKFDSFDDLPWLKEDMIPLLDETFPGSRWIYLERDEVSWKKSYKTWTASKGWVRDIEEGWSGYCRHRDFVLQYFRDRNDFLILDVRDPQGFKKLASFLGTMATDESFPIYNKST